MVGVKDGRGGTGQTEELAKKRAAERLKRRQGIKEEGRAEILHRLGDPATGCFQAFRFISGTLGWWSAFRIGLRTC